MWDSFFSFRPPHRRALVDSPLLALSRRTPLKKSTHEKRRSVRPSIVHHPLAFYPAGEGKDFVVREDKPREQTRRGKWKVFFHLAAAEIAVTLEQGGKGVREGESPVARGRRVKRRKSFNGDFICDGGAICLAGNPRLCSNGMGFVCYSAVAAFFS